MDPIQSIALIVLTLAGTWAVVELALTFRRARATVDALDKTVAQLNDTITEARPVVAKLDGAIDELEPSLAQVEPLLKKANVAVEALSADLIEVNGVIRDVSQLTGTVSSASETVNGIADAATEKVQRLFGKHRKPVVPSCEHVLSEPAAEGAVPVEEPSSAEGPAPARTYYTYADPVAPEAHAADGGAAKENPNE